MYRQSRVVLAALAALGIVVVVAVAQQNQADPFAGVELAIVPVAGQVHMVQRPGGGGNVGVFAGPDGVLLVDSLFAPLAERLVAAVRRVSAGEIRFLINTHVHPDHIGGNEPLARRDVLIFAHDNVRVRALEQLRFPQVAAGVLLLVPRQAHLGALLFLPVVVSIGVINVALDFGLTTAITALMLLAALYLCCWDYDRFRGLFTARSFEARDRIPHLALDRWERVAFTVFAIALLAFFGWTRGLVPEVAARLAVPIGLAAGVFTLLRFLLVTWRQRRASA